MKTFFRIFLTLLLSNFVFWLYADPVDLNTAQQVGKSFMNANAKVPLSGVNELQLVKTYLTANNRAAFYVFNSDTGFVIVSADNCATPILGFSDEGQFNPKDLPIQLEEYLQQFVEQIQYGIENHLVPDEKTKQQWALVQTTGSINDEKGMSSVDPLITATWGQGCNYNSLCPIDYTDPDYCNHALVGCVAVAMGQIMHYWGRPTTGTGSHSYVPYTHPEYGTQTVNFGATTYNWSNMPNYLTDASTNAQINAVATLLYHCGVSVDMDYGNITNDSGSGAFSENVPNALMSYFSYASDMEMIYKAYTSGWLELIKSSLNGGCPVYFSGASESGGHAFVCDGYNTSDMLHINWGWSGGGNGFYADGALLSYNYNNAAIINIHPVPNPSITYQITASPSPTTGGTVTGTGNYQAYQTCTLNASPAPGFSFLGWKDGSVIVSSDATYHFIVKQNRNLEAVFGLAPVSSVSASYYPDSNDPNSTSTQVSWDVVTSQTWSFDDGFDGWTTIDADGDGFNWLRASVLMAGYTITTHSGEDMLCSQSYDASAGPLSPNNYLVSPQVSLGGTIGFWACAQDANYAAEHFGVAVSTSSNNNASAFTTIQEWTLTSKGISGQVPRGTRDLGSWYYFTADLSSYAGQTGYVAIRHFNCTDMFYLDLDDVTISSGAGFYPPQTSFTEGFESDIPSEWRLIDVDGDGYYWEITGYPGHNSSNCISSASYINDVGILHPDNYLVSPQIALGGVFSFWACGQDANYAAEHFGVAVSTTSNTNASTFSMVQEWTLTAKGNPYNGPRGARTQGNWYHFTVDLSNFAGQTGYIAIRHFNCYDQFYINVDDIQYGFGKTIPQIQYYRIYRSTCGNTNIEMVTDQYTETSFIDNTWGDLPFGSYKYGVCSVGNVGNESEIIWSNCLDKGVGCTITATANPPQGGSITGAGLYEQGTTCTLEASPNTGYSFVNWTKDGTVVSTNASYSFSVTSDASYVANFEPNNYVITVAANPTDGGTVAGAGTYSHGTTVVLTASANEGYSFSYWTKDGAMVSGNATYSFTATEAGNYVANFSLNNYQITATANPSQGGTIIGAGTYSHGTTATLTATENTGYTFVNWTKNGIEVSMDMSYSFTVVESGTYIANFNANSYQITVSVEPEEGGVASGEGTYLYDETCTLTATANSGFNFVNWTLDGTPVSSDPTYTFIVTSDAEYVAHFSEEIICTIIVIAYPDEGGVTTGSGTYLEGETCTITATPNTGFTFVNWVKDGTEVSTDPSYSFTVTESETYLANFNQINLEIIVVADPEEGGEVSGGGTYQYGSTVTVEVTPNPHFTFENWTLNGTVVSEELAYTFEVVEDCLLVAHLHDYDDLGENSLSTIIVYPNPAKESFSIEGLESNATIEIYNSLGVRVKTVNAIADEEINISDLAPGVYMIRCGKQTMRFVKTL